MRNDVSKQTMLGKLLQYFLPATGALLIQFSSAFPDVLFDPIGRFPRQNASKVKKASLVRESVDDLGKALLALTKTRQSHVRVLGDRNVLYCHACRYVWVL